MKLFWMDLLVEKASQCANESNASVSVAMGFGNGTIYKEASTGGSGLGWSARGKVHFLTNRANFDTNRLCPGGVFCIVPALIGYLFTDTIGVAGSVVLVDGDGNGAGVLS